MTVLLIQPNHRRGPEDQGIWSVTAPIGLCYIAAVLEQHQIPVEILDANALNLNPAEVAVKIRSCNPTLVGISILTPDHDYCVEVVKNLNASYPVIAGGPHATALPDELLNAGFTIVVRAEGEYSMLDIAQQKPLSDIPGISYKSEGRIVHNTDRTPLNPDQLPLPARHLLLSAGVNLPYSSTGTRYFPWAEILTSRGCPYDCYYCNKKSLGYKFRPRSPENIVDEMEYLVKEYQVKEFNILDDAFNIDIERAERICDLIIKKKLNIKFRCSNGLRADKITDHLMQKMRAAGCYYVAFGIESGSQEVLDIIPKKIKLETIRNAIYCAKKYYFEITGFFMLGLMGDTPLTMRKTIDFAKELDVDIAQFTICTPYPGTRLWDMVQKDGKLLSKSYGDLHHTVGQARFTHPLAPSPAEVEKAYRDAHREFYFRPGYMFKKLIGIRSLGQLKMMTRGLMALIKIKEQNP
jgi:anaerobic magnesium-protoporphyrin IX monomethyl ester cyclase